MRGRPRADLGTRLRRVLVMVPWLLEEGGSTVADVARRFDMSEDEVWRDLTLLMCCGLPPYGGGDLIDVIVDDDGTIEALPGPFFERPMRLTSVEGFAVLAAGRALQGVAADAGAGAAGAALASALEKLETALGASGTLAVDLEAPRFLAEVRAAAEAGERVRVAYYSAWRDELSERVVEPLTVHSREGRWYVEAVDVTSRGEPRRLRVDRIRSLERTGERFERPASPPAPPEQLFSPGALGVEVVLVLPPSARWVVEAFDVEEAEELEGGRLRVRLVTAGERWLERLLLRAGPQAIVESPAELRGVGAGAAGRVLARYR
ncbi:MAG TPA: WYL domain-containing protein [Acidimicrobiales bacterium]